MRTVLSYPGNMAHAQNTALALHEAGCLDRFVTSLNWRPERWPGGRLTKPGCAAAQWMRRQAARKSVSLIRPDLVDTYPLGESMRVLTAAIGRNEVAADHVWDWSSHRFDRYVARRYVPTTEVIQAFEYIAEESFAHAAERGIARVLHIPSLDGLQIEAVQRRERARWPELAGAGDRYFAAKFERRYARRRAEIGLADVVVVNSTLTGQSHIAAGADPAKIRVVPLAAPPPVPGVEVDASRSARPLVAIWAGNFAWHKGAHYMLAAWRALAAGAEARLEVYGRLTVPERLLRAAPSGVFFHGSTPRAELFAAYENADVLVFPTLADGFGMVVTEAFAHGLPVITTDQAGSADLVDGDNGMVVRAADPQALADALRWCLSNRRRLAEMRHHALATARNRQWPDFRRDLIVALSAGLRQAGYAPRYALPAARAK